MSFELDSRTTNEQEPRTQASFGIKTVFISVAPSRPEAKHPHEFHIAEMRIFDCIEMCHFQLATSYDARRFAKITDTD